MQGSQMMYAISFLIIVGSGVFFASPPQKPGRKSVPAEVSVPSEKSTRPPFCDPALAALFTPRQPQLGRYEVCTTSDPLEVTAGALAKADWKLETMAPLDAFGAAGSYDKSALARLYGGRRASVAHGWIQENGHFESLTLISPYPDGSLSRLIPGTLIIRLIICCT